MIIASTPAISSLSTALNANIGGVTLTALPAPTLAEPRAGAAYSLQQSQVAQYSRNVYAVFINGVAANLGSAVAHENLVGPFGSPQPPAGTDAGVPIAPGASNDEAASAAVMSSLRNLAGNGKIFQ